MEPQTFISREDFRTLIETIKTLNNGIEQLEEALDTNLDSGNLVTGLDKLLCFLLDTFDDHGTVYRDPLISIYCFSYNFGQEYKGPVELEDGNRYPLSTVDELYDLLNRINSGLLKINEF